MRRLFIATALVLAGCSSSTSSHQERSPQEVVLSWQAWGGQLPSSEDIRVLKQSLPKSLQALRGGLRHQNEGVRICTADVLEKLGQLAAPLSLELRNAHDAEEVQLPRIYQAKAFAALGVSTQEMIDFLMTRFQNESNEQVRTYLAGSLVSLSSIRDEPQAWEWLKQSLRAFPPEPPTERPGKTVFWERRWGAAYMVRYLREERGLLLEALDHLNRNPKTPRWIKTQIREALADLKGRTRRIAEPAHAAD